MLILHSVQVECCPDDYLSIQACSPELQGSTLNLRGEMFHNCERVCVSRCLYQMCNCLYPPTFDVSPHSQHLNGYSLDLCMLG